MTNGRVGWLIYLLAGFTFTWLMMDKHEPPAFQYVSTKITTTQALQTQASPLIRSEFISGGLTKEVHSATAVELPDGDIGVFWYAGSREGSRDVAIFSRFLGKQTAKDNMGSWSDIRRVIDPQGSMEGVHRHIRKVGNPLVLYYQDKLWLFYVTVSVGGWAGSSINLIQSGDKGQTWSKPKRLITSPFLNISTLVKERAVIAADGSILLPVYHEFIGKFSEMLRIDPQGEVIDKYRISQGREAIQPIVLPQSQEQAIVFLRNVSATGSHRILASQTRNGGENWQSLSELELPNPDAAVSSVSLDRSNELLLVFNNDKKERSDLTLAYAADFQMGHPGLSGQWQILYQFENENSEKPEDAPHQEKLHNPYSYPFLVKTQRGDFHLFYSWKRQYIKHVFFNRAVLDKMITSRGRFKWPQDQGQN